MSRVILNHVTDILPKEVQSALKELDLMGDYEPRFHQDNVRVLRDELVRLTMLEKVVNEYAAAPAGVSRDTFISVTKAITGTMK